MSEFGDTHERLGRMHGYVNVAEPVATPHPELCERLERIETKVDALSKALLEMAKSMIGRGAL